MGLLPTAELVVLAVVVGLLAALTLVFVRRRYLSRTGGVFDCELRSLDAGSSGRWIDGLAHYDANSLEWYRILSMSFRPRVVLRRRMPRLLDHRAATPEEVPALLAGHRVVRLEVRSSSGEERIWELAMARESLVGLMSWLEAAPPGGASYKEYE